ncbi:unnamed protein product [Heligmosomoides polygyrus]|uniref:Reverse transcriptase domain-containing protein n=1 Tax=Heligmosomoides polygyrus TaxID=6339 RepID=A0A183FHC7_HELPZ|nr:unnamed protein product [Heligmosomoides polygyrus]
MMADFGRVCGNVGLRLDLTKTMFMRNGRVIHAPLSPIGTNTADYDCFGDVSLGREVDTVNDLAEQEETSGLGALKSV